MELIRSILFLFVCLGSSVVALDRIIGIKEYESLIGIDRKGCLLLGLKLEDAGWYAFRGVTVLGSETLQVCLSKSNNKYKQFFIFRNGKLVCIENRININELQIDDLAGKILKPVISHYGVKNSSKHFYKTSNIRVRGWLMRGKKTTSVIAAGEFKDNPNLSWVKIRTFDTRFFNYRNQRRFWLNHYGSERLLLR
jgi:hypothetical protein